MNQCMYVYMNVLYVLQINSKIKKYLDNVKQPGLVMTVWDSYRHYMCLRNIILYKVVYTYIVHVVYRICPVQTMKDV